MQQALRTTAVVQEGGVIQVSSPELPVGATAEVIVLVTQAEGPPTRLADMIGAGRGAFPTREAADRHLRRMRDEWDR